MSWRNRRLLGVLACIIAAAVAAPAASAATAWAVGLVAGSHAQATAQQQPTAPTGVTATCSLVSLQITVSWNATPHASSYTVYKSTTSASGPYTVAASGVTS